MGGGDLNLKKSWHPNTMKNQERVWKAEQAAAVEKNRILELQRERAEERDRDDLNNMAKSVNGTNSCNDDRLHWMYNKPDKKSQQEDYLLGKSIDVNYDKLGNTQQSVIPAVTRRVIGSSMLAAEGDTQVDLTRKMREDPLLLVKERERAARAALLNNPLQRRRIADLLRKEQESRKESKEKKKSSKKSKDLDNILASKLSALGGEKGIDLASLLENSTSSSSSEDEKTKKKKKKHEKNKKCKKSSKHKNRSKSPQFKQDNGSNDIVVSPVARKRKLSEEYSSNSRILTAEHKNVKKSESSSTNNRSRSPLIHYVRPKGSESDCRDKKKRVRGMTDEERAAKLAEMAAAGLDRERDRGRRVAEQRAVEDSVDSKVRGYRSRNEARTLPDSLQSRLHSNRHYIQRDSRHMNEHFAKR